MVGFTISRCNLDLPVQQRDVFLVIAGLECTRRLIDEESDTSPVEVEDYEEEPVEDDGDNANCHVLRVQKQYFMESCKLAQLGM
jgi:hypothetical protein